MITYYTDGSASPNPGPGGFAVIKEGIPYILGGEPNGSETTNIRMEGFAIKTALEDAAGEACQIYTDSEFWINVITKWAPGWAANGWKKKGGEIKNLDIVQAVYPLYTQSKATLTWVRGHEGDEGNELADEWANKARERRSTVPKKLEASVVAVSPNDLVKTHFNVARVMQLATLHEARPRVTSVFFVVNDDCTAVYWMSEPHRRHSNDTMGPIAGAVVVQESQPVIGLQFTGMGGVVEDTQELAQISSLYAQKYDGLGANLAERIKSGTNKHQLFKMTIDTLELFDEVHYPGGDIVTVHR